MSQAETTNRPLTPAELASLRESNPPYHPQRWLERLRAAIAKHHASGHSRTLLSWERDRELYEAAGLVQPKVTVERPEVPA